MTLFSNFSNRRINLIFILLASAVILGSILLNNYETTKITSNSYELIQAIGKQKVVLLGRWFANEEREIIGISRSAQLKRYVECELTTPGICCEKLQEYLKAIRKASGAKSVLLINETGELLASSDSTVRLPNLLLPDQLSRITQKSATYKGFYYKKEDQTEGYFFLMAPINLSVGRTIYLVSYIAADEDIYPIIDFWPSATKTGESFIVKPIGDSIEYLSHLRFKDSTQLNTITLNHHNLGKDSRSINGYENIYRANDYRGEEVIAYSEKIPGTDWSLITKIDKSEVIHPQFILGIYRTFVMLLLVFIAYGFIYFRNNKREKALYFQLYSKEKEINQFRKEFEALIDSVGDGLIITDMGGKIVFLNRAAIELTESETTALKDTDYRSFYHTSNPIELTKIIQHIKPEKEKMTISLPAQHINLITHQRKVIPIVEKISFFKTDNPETGRIIITFLDDTKNRELEEKTKQAELWQRTLMKGLPDALLVFDNNGSIIDINDNTLKLYGYEKNELIEQHINILIPQRLHQVQKVNLEDYFKNPAYLHMGINEELIAVRKDGSEFPIDVAISPVSANHNLYTICIIRDITVAKRAQRALKEALKKAEESDELKTIFLQNILHEIRTPLNGIQGFTNLLESHDVNKLEKQEYLHQVSESATRLMNTLTDIIELSIDEANESTLNIEAISIDNLLSYYYNSFSNKAVQKGLSFKYFPEQSSINLLIHSDQQKLGIIIANILSNALKFTDTGHVYLGFQTTNSELSIFVEDTGPGIPDDQFNHIFEKFTQLDNGYTRRYEGNGLGLAVVKALSNQLNARVWVNSTPGEGSTFFLSLPINPA